ncbi:ROK family protein [Fulvivirgaceae bacterium BMA12]|uniref:ROK family protein n=1 Tax=Agaribacillus aureus TaxID=3051825 RepID=A0ABT8L9Z9_9BACT|nr:ROK family protein [Fulvivirgaceae bacterium BMA12]
MADVVIGIDIGGTITKFGLMTATGKVVFHDNMPTTGFSGFDEYFKALTDKLSLACKKTASQVLGVGVGAPMGNFIEGSIDMATNLGWGKKVPVAGRFSEFFNKPAYLVNDATAAAIGEKTFGLAKKMDDFLLITLGTGLGCGIYVNGKLLHGKHGYAGELGHVTVIPEGRKCNCGRLGCLETYVSASGVMKSVREFKTKKGFENSVLHDEAAYPDSKAVARAAANGDPLAEYIFEFTGEVLASSLANVIAMFNPEAIIFSGGLANAGSLLIGPLEQFLSRKVLHNLRGKTKIYVSKLDSEKIAVLGAASYAWQMIEEHSHNKSLVV